MDRRVSGGAYSWPSPAPVDAALWSLSGIAGTFWFWIGLAGAVFITGRNGRHAAFRGVLSLATQRSAECSPSAPPAAW
jgi:hypothetical protein